MYVRTAARSLILRERRFTFCLARLRAWGELANVILSFYLSQNGKAQNMLCFPSIVNSNQRILLNSGDFGTNYHNLAELNLSG